MKKRLVAFLLVLIMVLGMLPVSAFAADDGVSPQALNTGHKIDVTFTVLYVGNEFNIGYNYGTSEKTQFVCQYSTPHSDTAYNNHTIAISDIKAAADRATVNSGYQIVGWSKEANANPKTWGFDLKDPTACNKGTTIYLVAKNPNPNPTYMYYLYYKYNDGTNSTWLTEVTDRPTEATTFTFYVNGAKLKDRRGYEHIGWADKADAAAAKYTGGEPITLTKDDPAKTIYAVWMPFFELKYDANGGTGAPDSQTRTASHPTVNQVTFTVRDQIPTKEGCTFKGWADSATATDAQYQPGGTIAVKHENSPKTVYAVWEESAPQPPLIPVPSYDDLKSAIGKIQVKDVSTSSCGTENYDLIDNTQSDPFNWTKTARLDQPGKYDVTIKTAPYVAKYNSEKTKTHELNNANQTTLNLVISYENNKWVLDDGLRVIEVKHSEQTPPVDKPNPPTQNDLLGLTIAKVYCAMPANHGPKDFTYIKGTLDTSRTYTVNENGFCTVYLSVAPYVASYNGYYTSSSHARRAEDPATVPVTLVYRTDHWEVAREGDAEALADIPVYCAETPVKPAKPTALDGSFAIVCKNNEATHAHKADYIATPSQYTISDVQTDEQGYYVTATVTVAPNLVAYNTLTGAEHRLVNEQDATLTITFRYDTEVTVDENRKWEQQGEVPVVEVICKPKAPTADDLKKLEMAVQVKCVVDDSQQHTAAYDLLGEYDEDYFVGEPRKDGDDWLCDINYYPERYVAEFNTTFQNLKHVQNDEKIVPVTLIWAGDSWQIKEQGRVHVTEVYTVTYTDGVENEEVFADQVYSDLRKDSTTPAFNGTPTRTGYTFAGWEPEVAETVTANATYTAKWMPVEPKAPTADELKELDMAVLVKCVVDNSQQHTEAYGLLGECDVDYFVGEPRKDGDDWLCDINYYPERYVAEFNTTFQNLKHVQNDEKIVPVTLIWAGDSWQIKEQGRVHVTEEYTVTFNAYGGFPTPDEQHVKSGEKAVLPVAPTLKGYTFAFWYLGEDEQNATAYDFNTPVTENITLTAKWNINKYTVTFNSYGGSKVDPQVVEYGLYAQEPEEPTLKGFTFAYWYLDDENEAYDFDTTPITEDITLTAKWEINKFKVTFDTDGGEPIPDDQFVEWGLFVEEPTTEPTKTGYTFDGWYLGDERYDFSAAVEQNITLTAKWEAKKANVHLMIFKSGDLSTPIVNVPYATDKLAGDTIDLAEIDLSSYLDFDFEIDGGWYDDGLFNLYKKYVNGEQENKPAALTELQINGNWQNLKLIVTELVPVVYFDSLESLTAYQNDHSKTEGILHTTKARLGSALPTTDAPTATRDGYTFTFWSREGQLGTDVTGQTVNGWTNLVANWKANTYTVKFAPNGGEGTMADQNFTYDVEQALTANAFTRTGYTFTGWKDDGNTYTDGQKVKNLTAEPDGTVTLYAQWEARTDTPYTVEHYLENLDGSYALDTTEPLKGTTDTTVTAAAKSYDNFTYDSTVPGTVASGNIAGDGSLVLKLFYTRNTYDYTVRHIKQLPDGTYDEANAEVETLSGKFEALAAVTAKDYGSHYPTNDADTKQNIKIEKGLTIDVKYDLDEHTLTFETNGGSTIAPVTVRHGNAVARPADPTKDKYTFIGWYADPEFTEEYDFATVLEADKTIYAKFELTSTPIGDIYVRYDVLHIKQLPDGSYDLANAEVEHLSAKKDTTVTAVVKDYSATHHINVNSTLSKLTDTAIQPYPGADGKPVYTILSVYYDLDFHTLTFDTMGGSRIDPVTVRHGNAVAKPKDPVNGGYIFDGWYTDKTYRTPYNFATVLTQDTTIYAKWFLIALPGVTIKKTTPKLNTSDHFAYVQGYPDGTVKPAGNITRAETAAILFRLMDEGSRKTYYSTKSGFRDVATGSWYNTYVATLNNAGVITDSSNGYFRPNEAITRAELAAMLANFTETAGAANYFNDVSARYWAANAIAICAKLGWITGYPDGSFRPDRNVTRAELMAMINRATGRAPKSADAFLPGMKTWSDNTADKWYYLDVQEATNSHSYTVKDSEKWTALNADPNWSLYE